jgi:hypothetical protein
MQRKLYNTSGPEADQTPAYLRKPTYNTGAPPSHYKAHFGGKHTDERASAEILRKMETCNTLTICSSKSPEYYLDLIRHHFRKTVDDPSKKVLCLQALGLSC